MGSRITLAILLVAASTTRAGAVETTPSAGRGWVDSTGTHRLHWHDDLSDPSPWSAHPASGVQMSLHAERAGTDDALRVDFSFSGAGWAIVRREVGVDLPENYRIVLSVRGESAPQTLELKLLDASGENVWWHVRRDHVFDGSWQHLSTKKRQIVFAWGPRGGGELRRLSALEVAITASSGGTGSVWIDDVRLEELPPPDVDPPTPVVTASSSTDGSRAEAVLDDDASTSWSPRDDDEAPWIALDLGTVRELGGVVLDWAPGRGRADYVLESSDDGRQWQVRAQIDGSNGGRDWLRLPESEMRWVRLRWEALPVRATVDDVDHPPALASLRLKPVDWAPRPSDLHAEIAAEHRRGAFPRAYVGEQSYWTVVGLDGDTEESLMDEGGAIELGAWRPSLEPFVALDGRLWTWADASSESGLGEGDLPFPWVRWRMPDLSLQVTASAVGDAGASGLILRYRLRNEADRTLRPTLHLAVRAFQVNPPQQVLGSPGGVAPIHELRMLADRLELDGRVGAFFLDEPDRVGASTFHGGDVVAEHLLAGVYPAATEVSDSFGAASGVASYPLVVEPGRTEEIRVFVPLHEVTPRPPSRPAAEPWLDEQTDAARARWRARADALTLRLPPSARWIEQTLRAQIGYVLVHRDGPAIQPGSRSYARSWIRDGALTSSALLRLGHADVAREFVEWFAPFQFADGKVPCVVDARGADPVPEHDSGGELVFLVAELVRFTGDLELGARMWPRVQAAAAYLDSLRQLRRTEQYRQEQGGLFYGLLPPSISHEGYSAAPMHSYWDDFWALRGFRDTAWLADRLGNARDAAHWSAVHGEFAADIARSVRTAMEVHGVDYVPGCADLGDFDPTSTTIALAPTGAASILPRGAVDRTFERYWEFFVRRRDTGDWEAYTPYELRNVGAFVRLGWRQRAHELLAWFGLHQRPAGWHHWAEVVVREERAPRFLGDMPHTWVGTDFARAVLSLFAYVDGDEETALVLAAGVPARWIDEEPGVEVSGLRTPFGRLDLSLRTVEDRWEITVGGDLRIPPDGVWLDLPLDRIPAEVTVDGHIIQFSLGPPMIPIVVSKVPTVITVLR